MEESQEIDSVLDLALDFLYVSLVLVSIFNFL